jgi:thioredoxin 1
MLTMSELQDAIEGNDEVVIDFAAPSWCVPCQRLAPHYEAVAEKRPDTLFVHVDIDKADKAVLEYYNIQGVPYVLAYSEQEFVGEVKERTAPKLTKELDTLFS